jgi:hypothetical protein
MTSLLEWLIDGSGVLPWRLMCVGTTWSFVSSPLLSSPLLSSPDQSLGRDEMPEIEVSLYSRREIDTAGKTPEGVIAQIHAGAFVVFTYCPQWV